MPFSTMLAVVGLTHLAVAFAFLRVGRASWRRPVAASSRTAVRAFTVWWWGLAAYLAMVGLLDVAAAFGWAPLRVHVATRLLAGPVLGAAVAGLAFHILYILTGRAWIRWPIALYYGAAGLAYDALILLGRPTGVVVGDFQVDLVPGVRGPYAAWWQLVLTSFGLPAIGAGVAFLVLGLRSQDRAQRRRGVLVGASIACWVASGLAAQLGTSAPFKFVTLVLFGLAAAVLVTIAYVPAKGKPATVTPAGT